MTTTVGTFEVPALADGEARIAPGASPWTFSGTAGIYRQATRQPATLSELGSEATVEDGYPLRGWRFQTGADPVAIYAIGRRVQSGNDGTHQLSVFRDDGDGSYTQVLLRSVDLSGASIGDTVWTRTERNIFIIGNKFYHTPTCWCERPARGFGKASSGQVHLDDDSRLVAPAATILGGAKGLGEIPGSLAPAPAVAAA